MSEAFFTFIGAVIGSSITWFSAIYAADRQAFNSAGASLRAVFASIQSRIRNEKVSEWNEFRTEMQNLFDTHAIEFEKFRFYVSKSRVTEYDTACRDYRNVVHSRSITSATTPRGTTPDARTDAERFLGAIDAILGFTEVKNKAEILQHNMKSLKAKYAHIFNS